MLHKYCEVAEKFMDKSAVVCHLQVWVFEEKKSEAKNPPPKKTISTEFLSS